MSKVVVTGGAGFIGSHIVDALIEKGHEVTVIDNFSTGKSENLNPKARLVANDVTSSGMEESFKGAEYVYHLAAQINLRLSIEYPVLDCQENVLGTVSTLEYAAKAGAKKFIYFSTGGALYAPVYDAIPWKEGDRIMPLSPYGVSKWCGERYVELYGQTRGLDYVIFRPANVYGPRQDPRGEAGVVSIFLERIQAGEKAQVFGDGRQLRDFIYVDDVVRAAVLAMESNIRGPYNVSTGLQNPVMRLACMMFDKLGKEFRITKMPAIKGEMYASCLDSTKLSDAGWPEPMSLDDGLNKLCRKK
jgi:UDP-glucose 4-epimerase